MYRILCGRKFSFPLGKYQVEFAGLKLEDFKELDEGEQTEIVLEVGSNSNQK